MPAGSIPGAFMLVSPLPEEILTVNNLTQVRLSEDDMGLFQDLLITRRGHRCSEFEQAFLSNLQDTEREIMGSCASTL